MQLDLDLNFIDAILKSSEVVLIFVGKNKAVLLRLLKIAAKGTSVKWFGQNSGLYTEKRGSRNGHQIRMALRQLLPEIDKEMRRYKSAGQ